MRALIALLLVAEGGDAAGLEVEEVVRRYEVVRTTDAATGRETLKAPGCTIVFAPGLEAALVNGEVRKLSKPVELRDGRLVLPPELVSQIDTLALKRKAAKSPVAKAGKKGFKIVLDPGHGWMDTGGQAKSGLCEKEVVLDVSLRLRKLLENFGVDVVMTRSSDATQNIDKREDLSRRVEIANAAKADFFMSIHANWHPTPDPRGFEIWIPRDNRGGSRRMADEIRKLFRARLDTEDRGIKQKEGRTDLYVLGNTNAPAVLVELEFISNPKGERELGSTTHRQKLAECLFDAVKAYIAR